MRTEHTYANNHPMRYLHALDCPACLEQDRAGVLQPKDQADPDAEEGYCELQAALARGEKIPETAEF